MFFDIIKRLSQCEGRLTSGRYDRAFALMEPLVKPIEGVSAAQNRIFRRAEGRDDVETALKAGERIDDLQRDGLRIIQMSEIPSNAILAKEFIQEFDGFSIGSNDMTQLTLGLDRDSGLVAASFDERNEAVKIMLSMAIRACRARGKYVGICGQGPSDHEDLAQWLMDEGIESISLNPDTVVDTWRRLAASAKK